jgi:hypothetical protein
MKKLIALSVAFALVATAAFAEVKVGVYARGSLGYGKDSGDGAAQDKENGYWWAGDAAAPGGGANATVGNMKTEIRITAVNDDKTAGANIWVDLGYLNATGIEGNNNQVDNTHLWVKPVDAVKLTLGRYVDDALRGKVTLDDRFAHFAGSVRPNGDLIFKRFKSLGLKGALVSVTPIEGLFIGFQPGNAWGNATNTVATASTPIGSAAVIKLGEVQDGNGFQVGAGYTLPNIGQIRAQYVGLGDRAVNKYKGKPVMTVSSGDNAGIFEAAFAYTALKGYVFDLGAKFAVGGSDDGIKAEDIAPVIALGASAAIDKFTVKGLVAAYLYKDKTVTDAHNLIFAGGTTDKTPGEILEGNIVHKQRIDVGIEAAYNLGFLVAGLNAEIRSQEDNGVTGAAVWVRKDFGPSYLKGGIGFASREVNALKRTSFYVPIVAVVSL